MKEPKLEEKCTKKEAREKEKVKSPQKSPRKSSSVQNLHRNFASRKEKSFFVFCLFSRTFMFFNYKTFIRVRPQDLSRSPTIVVMANVKILFQILKAVQKIVECYLVSKHVPTSLEQSIQVSIWACNFYMISFPTSPPGCSLVGRKNTSSKTFPLPHFAPSWLSYSALSFRQQLRNWHV